MFVGVFPHFYNLCIRDLAGNQNITDDQILFLQKRLALQYGQYHMKNNGVTVKLIASPLIPHVMIVEND